LLVSIFVQQDRWAFLINHMEMNHEYTYLSFKPFRNSQDCTRFGRNWTDFH